MDDGVPTTRAGRAALLGRLGVRMGARVARTRVSARRTDWSETNAELAQELLSTLGRMRGVPTKFGQLLAQRPGVLPGEYVDAMLTLSDRAPPMGYPLVKTQFRRDFGTTPRKLFLEFEHSPLAAASFGQVHRARLKDGRSVAVKVQYPGVRDSLRSDFDNLRLLILPAQHLLGIVNAEEIFGELEAIVTAELDYSLELTHLELFQRMFAEHPTIRIPRAHPDLSRRHVLTMDLLPGTSLTTSTTSLPPAIRSACGRALLEFTWISVFDNGVVHGDPNPGNYLFGTDGTVGVVDFGCVRRFSTEFVTTLKSLVRASITGTRGEMRRLVVDLGLVPKDAPAELRELFTEQMQLWGRPFSGYFDFTDPTYLDALLRMHELLRKLMKRRVPVQIPREILFYARHILGCTVLLYRLGLAGDFTEAVRKHL